MNPSEAEFVKYPTIVKLSCGNVNIQSLEHITVDMYEHTFQIIRAPTDCPGDVDELYKFADVITDEDHPSECLSQHKHMIVISRRSELWRGATFNGQVRNIELWYGGKMLATWKKAKCLVFTDFLPLFNLTNSYILTWDGLPDITLGYHIVRELNPLFRHITNPNTIIISDVDKSKPYKLVTSFGNVHNVLKKNFI